MTPDKINQAIAEWMGWKWYRRPATGPWAKKPMRSLYHPELMKPLELELADMTERECNYVFMEREGMIPNFYGDRNAFHSAYMNLMDGQKHAFLQWLACVIHDVDFDYFAHLTWSLGVEIQDATLPECCEALLRTIGRWEA